MKSKGLPYPINRRVSYSYWEEEGLETEGFRMLVKAVEDILEMSIEDRSRALLLLKKSRWNKRKMIENVKKNKAYYRDFFNGLQGQNIVKQVKKEKVGSKK
mmetsp:Transcript_107664/g.150142  ORF Transcript_107664/g.150142 Transcript_107664/m.150142 type:complete len:101 (+) Transcript_107664:463-765(+)